MSEILLEIEGFDLVLDSLDFDELDVDVDYTPRRVSCSSETRIKNKRKNNSRNKKFLLTMNIVKNFLMFGKTLLNVVIPMKGYCYILFDRMNESLDYINNEDKDMVESFKITKSITLDVDDVMKLLKCVFFNLKTFINYFIDLLSNKFFPLFFQIDLLSLVKEIDEFLIEKEKKKVDRKKVTIISKEERILNSYDKTFYKSILNIINQEKLLTNIVGLKMTDEITNIIKEMKNNFSKLNCLGEYKFLFVNLDNSVYKTSEKCFEIWNYIKDFNKKLNILLKNIEEKKYKQKIEKLNFKICQICFNYIAKGNFYSWDCKCSKCREVCVICMKKLKNFNKGSCHICRGKIKNIRKS